MEQNKARISRNHSKTKEMELNWTYLREERQMTTL
jgi:hypothetical protein